MKLAIADRLYQVAVRHDLGTERPRYMANTIAISRARNFENIVVRHRTDRRAITMQLGQGMLCRTGDVGMALLATGKYAGRLPGARA